LASGANIEQFLADALGSRSVLALGNVIVVGRFQ
jgi:hypothetical protein